jgi:hypothetical protein
VTGLDAPEVDGQSHAHLAVLRGRRRTEGWRRRSKELHHTSDGPSVADEGRLAEDMVCSAAARAKGGRRRRRSALPPRTLCMAGASD